MKPAGSGMHMDVGIDDIAIHFPRLFFDMRDFAAFRGADYDKLNKGLGLNAMAIPDAHEDTATMGANAVARLIDRNGLDPKSIGRIYLGTESALDGAKPTATYIIDMLQQRYTRDHGEDCFRNCDVVDMTFACIGAVDALHNTLDWVARGGEDGDRIGIVVFSDNAKYEMKSTGEYTQGAGGGAMLVRMNPRLLVIPDHWGVSTTPVHDFFKPRREVPVRSVIDRVLALAREAGQNLRSGLSDRMMRTLRRSEMTNDELFAEETLKIHRDTPVFDGQFSNRCYMEAVKEAFIDFHGKAVRSGRHNPENDPILTEQWKRIIVHLPYAFQGKRMFPDVFRHDRRGTEVWKKIVEEIGEEPLPEHFDDTPEGLEEFGRLNDAYRRAISKTEEFKQFANERIERGQRASSLIGNQYTGSIFLALMSTLECDYNENNPIEGREIGLCGYGSGAKAKVFEGIVQSQWKEIASRFMLFERLDGRYPIQSEEYEALHRGARTDSIVEPKEEFIRVKTPESEGLPGERRYRWVD